MYNINSKTDKPDIGYMEYQVKEMMKRGIKLGNCKEILEYYTNVRNTALYELQTKCGIENPNSSQQVTNYLRELSSRVDLGSRNDIINICYNGETGKWTSKASAMSKLADLGYEFAQDLIDYRQAKKYTDCIEKFASLADSEGCVHPIVGLAKTNRISYSEPALMSIPKKLLWHMVVPYNTKDKLYSVDIKNQEPNIMINMTGAEELKPALESNEGLYETLFKQCYSPVATANVLVDTLPENRVYTMHELKQIGTISPAMYSPVRPQINSIYYNGKRVVGIETICISSSKGVYPTFPETVDIETEDGEIYPVHVTWGDASKKYKKAADYAITGKLEGVDIKVSKVERKEFKVAWNAISYGASIFGVKEICKTIDGSQLYHFATKVDGLKRYRSIISDMAKQFETSIKTLFGSVVDAGYVEDSKQLKRKLLDLPIQGTGADILSLLIRHFNDTVSNLGIADKMFIYYTRHDELIIEVKEEYFNEVGKEKVVAFLKDTLEHQIDNWTPFKVEINQVNKNTEDLREILSDDEEAE